MLLNSMIVEVFQEEATEAIIDRISIGLGYTAVTLIDGRCGLYCTLLDGHSQCTVNKDPTDYEKHLSLPLLQTEYIIRFRPIENRVDGFCERLAPEEVPYAQKIRPSL